MTINEIFLRIGFLKEFVIVTVLLGLIMSIYVNYVNSRYTRKKYATNIANLFFKIDKLSILKLCFSFLEFTFVLSMVLRYDVLNYIHVFTFLGILILNVILNYNNLLNALSGALNGGIQLILLLLLNVIVNYLKNIRFNTMYVVIYIIASFVIVMYSLYIFLNQMTIISKERVKNEK